VLEGEEEGTDEEDEEGFDDVDLDSDEFEVRSTEAHSLHTP
jgi:hypothetical protein